MPTTQDTFPIAAASGITPPPRQLPQVIFGTLQVRNTSGASVQTLNKQIACSTITPTSVITVQIERDSSSAAGVAYVANLANNSRTPGTGFSVDVRRSTSANIANNEGCTLNYIVMDWSS